MPYLFLVPVYGVKYSFMLICSAIVSSLNRFGCILLFVLYSVLLHPHSNLCSRNACSHTSSCSHGGQRSSVGFSFQVSHKIGYARICRNAYKHMDMIRACFCFYVFYLIFLHITTSGLILFLLLSICRLLVSKTLGQIQNDICNFISYVIGFDCHLSKMATSFVPCSNYYLPSCIAKVFLLLKLFIPPALLMIFSPFATIG